MDTRRTMIVHLNGWPGAGKKTIGEVLSKKLDALFVHNHLLHDVALVCAGFDSPDRWDLYETVRAAAYRSLARQPSSKILVMTNALCKNSAREQKAWKHVVELAMSRNVPLVPVVLQVAFEENCRRLQSAERVGKKLTDPTELREYLSVDVLQKPDVPELLVIDASDLSSEQAAEGIRSHIVGIIKGLHPATTQHLNFRP